MKAANIIFVLAIATTTIFFAVKIANIKHYTYQTLVIFDDTKPLGHMGDQYNNVITGSEYCYKVGDTLKGLCRDQVILAVKVN